MSYYIENAYLEEVRRQSLKKDEERIKKIESISLEKKDSNNIHAILVDNYRIRNNRKNIIPLITDLLNENRNGHFVIILYADDIRMLVPVLPLNEKTIKLISKVINVTNYDGCSYYRKEDIKELVKTKAIMNVPSLEFLKDYPNVFFYE